MSSTLRDGVGKELQRQDYPMYVFKMEFMAYNLQNNLCLMRKTFLKLPIFHRTVKADFDILMSILPAFKKLIYVEYT